MSHFIPAGPSFDPVTEDVSLLHLAPGKSKLTHLGCHGSRLESTRWQPWTRGMNVNVLPASRRKITLSEQHMIRTADETSAARWLDGPWRLPAHLAVVMATSLLLAGCSRGPSGVFQGYVEGEYVHVAAPVGGALKRLAVQRGQQVKTGDLLYELDPEPERAVVQQAEQRVAQAEARLADLTKGLRPSEIAALEAQLASAQANAALAASELDRFSRLSEEQVISPDEMDRARTRRDAGRAQVASLEAELETARLGGRENQVEAGRAEVAAARAALDQARWALTQKSQVAPTNGVVHDTLYREGEWVAAGRPVVSLLPPTNRKVRFFVPQERLPDCQPGVAVSVRVDGLPDAVPGTISYVSTEAEFTPPVIYSRENRAKLVFMIEAQFSAEQAARLSPGQPADVKLGERAGVKSELR